MKRVFTLTLFIVGLIVKLQSQNTQQKYDKQFYLIDIAPDFVFDPTDKHDIDSILRLYHATKNDTLRLYYLRVFSEGLTNEYLWTRYNKYLYQQSLAKNDSLYVFYKACAINNLGYESQYIKNDLESAKKSYHESYELFKGIRHGSGLAVEINNLAYLYQHEGNIEKSVELYLEAAKYFEKENQALGLAGIYINLGDIYYKNDDNEKAEDFFNKALFYAKKSEQKLVIANAYNQLGAINSGNNKIDTALSYYHKALDIYLKEKDYSRVSLVCIGLYNNYKKLNKIAESEKYIHMAYANSLLASDMQIKAKVYDYIALMYLDKKDLKNAKSFADSSFSFAKALNYPELMVDASLKLSEVYKQTGKYELAWLYLNKAKAIQDSIRSDAAKKAVIKSQYQIEYNKKSIELKAEQDKKDAIRKAEKKQQQLILGLTLVALTIIAVFAFIAFKNYRKTKKQNVIIERQNVEVSSQKALIEEKQKEIIDSITYAKRLQEAILPPKEFINAHLPENFILYQPKDLVAGDFYWAEKIGDLFFIAAADSTGHGVPGALVSVVCSNALNRSIKEFGLIKTGEILDKTRELILETFDRKDFHLESGSRSVKDGMDISLLCIDLKKQKIFWSGANNPLWYVYQGNLTELKADKQAVGKTENPKPFTTNEIEYKKDTMFYLFTDGFADQFGGPGGKKFKYKQFSDLLVEHSARNMQEQIKLVSSNFNKWKGELEQVDDVCVIGLRL